MCSPLVLGASGHFIEGQKIFVCGSIPWKGNSYAQSLWITSAKMYFPKGKRGKKLKNSVRAASLLRVRSFSDHWRRHPDLNRGIKVLQTFALPLGYSAVYIFPRQFRKTAQIFRLKRWRLRKTRRNRNFERQLALARGLRLKSRLCAEIFQSTIHPSGGNETCAYSGAPRQTAHRAVCFAVEGSGTETLRGKTLAPARGSALKSRLCAEIFQSTIHPSERVYCALERETRLEPATFTLAR